MISRRGHVGGATRYCKRVVGGRTPACKWTRLACQRQLDDLARAESGDPGFPYVFDVAAAERVCKFIELLPHVKGRLAKRIKDDPTAHLIRLEPWQQFTLTTLFGWMRLEDGSRRFRTGYEEEARKNGKSTKSSGVGLYMVALDGEPGADVFASATKREQAKIVFGDAQKMAERSPEFRLRYGIETRAHAIIQAASGSRFVPLDAKSSTQDGLNVHCVINDEVHAQKSRALYDVLHSGMSARDQPLEYNITTAGSNRAGVCYELRTYLCKILEGVIQDESFFGVIYTLDADDPWHPTPNKKGDITEAAWRRIEKVWRKANPNLGVSKRISKMREDCRKAMHSAASQNEFLTKDCNLWVNADIAWMSMKAWDACADPSLRLEDFAGEHCWIGLDLATKVDVASKAYIFRRDNDYYLFIRRYLPQAAVENGASDHYKGWAADGWIEVTPGNVIDLDLIEKDILGDTEDGTEGDKHRFEIQVLGYDPWQAQQLANHLIDDGAPAVEIGATVKNFSEPMKELEALVLDGRLHHQGDPVLTWMVSNVVCHRDKKDNIYPNKERPENKIDDIVAAIMALNRAIQGVATKRSVYESADVFM